MLDEDQKVIFLWIYGLFSYVFGDIITSYIAFKNGFIEANPILYYLSNYIEIMILIILGKIFVVFIIAKSNKYVVSKYEEKIFRYLSPLILCILGSIIMINNIYVVFL